MLEKNREPLGQDQKQVMGLLLSPNLVYNNVPVINDIERAAPLELLEKRRNFQLLLLHQIIPYLITFSVESCNAVRCTVVHDFGKMSRILVQKSG